MPVLSCCRVGCLSRAVTSKKQAAVSVWCFARFARGRCRLARSRPDCQALQRIINIINNTRKMSSAPFALPEPAVLRGKEPSLREPCGTDRNPKRLPKAAGLLAAWPARCTPLPSGLPPSRCGRQPCSCQGAQAATLAGRGGADGGQCRLCLLLARPRAPQLFWGPPPWWRRSR